MEGIGKWSSRLSPLTGAGGREHVGAKGESVCAGLLHLTHTHLFFLLPQIMLYSLEAERCLAKLGNSLGHFTCVNLRDSPPNLMVSGNMDRRYV